MTKREQLVDILGQVGLKDLARGDDELGAAQRLFTMLSDNDKAYIGEPKKKRKKRAKAASHEEQYQEITPAPSKKKKQLEIQEDGNHPSKS